MYTVTVEFSIHQAYQDAFSKLVLKQASDSLNKEKECHVFDVSVGQSEGELVSFFLYELYTDKQSFDQHLETAHFASFSQAITEMVAEKTVRLWDKLS